MEMTWHYEHHACSNQQSCPCTHTDEEHLLLSDIQDHRTVSVNSELCYPAAIWSSQEGSGVPVLERVVLSVSHQRKLSLAGHNP